MGHADVSRKAEGDETYAFLVWGVDMLCLYIAGKFADNSLVYWCIGIVLIITSMIYRSKSMRAGATNAEGARCCRVATVFILVVIAAAICVLVSFAQDMRTTTFICLEILTLVAWPLVFAVVLTIDSRK